MPSGIYPRTDRHRKIISNSLRGRHHSEETKRKIALGNKGKEVSKETKEKLRLQAKNNPNYGNKGKKFTKEHRQKIAESNRRRIPPSGWHHTEEAKKKMSQPNELNAGWKGDKVGYAGIHAWVERWFGKAKNYPCMFCGGTKGSKRIEWANISGKYRRDPQDWTTLCKSCHQIFDYQKK